MSPEVRTILSDFYAEHEFQGYSKEGFLEQLEKYLEDYVIVPKMEVALLQPDDDCPGLWIGFRTGSDRDTAMGWFKTCTDQ